MRTGYQVTQMHARPSRCHNYIMSISAVWMENGEQQNTTVMSYEERFPLSMWKLRSAVIDIPNIEKNIQQRIEKGVRA